MTLGLRPTAPPSDFQRVDMSHQPPVFAFHRPDSLTPHFQNNTKIRRGEGTRSSAFALQSGLHRLARQDKDRDSETGVKVPVWDSTVSATYAWKDGQRPKGVEKSALSPLRYQHQDQSHFLPPRTCATGSCLRHRETSCIWDGLVLLNCAAESPPCTFLQPQKLFDLASLFTYSQQH